MHIEKPLYSDESAVFFCHLFLDADQQIPEQEVSIVLVQKNPRELIHQQAKSEMSGSRVKSLKRNMQANGFDPNYPITGVQRDDGRIVISDGHHRVRAAIAAGIQSVPVDVYVP